MANKLDLSLDEIIVREGITFNGSKNRQTFNYKDMNKSEDKIGVKNNFEVNNDSQEGSDQSLNQSIKRKTINESNEKIVSKRVNNNSHHFENSCGALFITNLKYEVTDEDIQQLFGAFGQLKRAAINYQSNGRSAGTAFVVFERKCDAITAFGSLKNITLDGLCS
jgi:RNA recognition motif-containing protein